VTARAAAKPGLFGFIDKDGKMIISPRFEEVGWAWR